MLSIATRTSSPPNANVVKVTYGKTLTTRRGTYFSRSRNELWVKGATSGHTQYVREVWIDCDGDTVLVRVDQTGPACHTGTESCFGDADRLLLGEPAGRA